MEPFFYKNNQLFCEDVPLEDLASRFGTPLYVYSHAFLKDQFARFQKAFGKVNPLVCYSMKANSSRAILKVFVGQGGGIDVVTGGELRRALSAGCPPQKIVYSGVGKQEEEIRAAISAGILQFNVESEMELEKIAEVATAMKKKAPVALRVNPDVDPKTHAYIATGLKKSKFGIEHHRAVELFVKAQKMKGIEIVGIDCHIGSQLTSVSPFVAAAERVKAIVGEQKEEGIEIINIEFCGGLG
ncbi:MAG: diaminopimelate decarboxylase, partial [Deltaproteobacteria bacterium]|nr:diaminopimelate decarboxylase [Deltaproteobacteria bacterium]